jgi:hypothetical protein
MAAYLWFADIHVSLRLSGQPGPVGAMSEPDLRVFTSSESRPAGLPAVSESFGL